MTASPFHGVASWFERWGAIRGEEPALIFDEVATSWREMDRRIDAWGHTLRESGVAPGDRVALYLRNRPEFVVGLFAICRIGGVAVLVNHFLSPSEVRYVLDDAGVGVVLTEETFSPVLAEAGLPDGTVAFTLAAEPRPDDELDRLATSLGADGATSPAVPVELSDPAMIVYTSGTTGFPKGAITSHGALHFSSMQWMPHAGFQPGDIQLVYAPLGFTGGTMAGLMPSVHSGGTILLRTRFEAGAALEHIERYGVRMTQGVPATLQAMVRHPDFQTRDLSSLRVVFTGASPVPLDLLEAFETRGIPIVQAYALTEANSLVLAMTHEEARTKHGSCGRPVLYTRADVVDGEGRTCAPGEVGELMISGPVLFSGYWGNPEATAAAVVDGWLRTGDLVTRDTDGFYFMVDRKKDVIISGGLNVYPAEVERVLMGMPGLSGVAVVGLPDERWGEAVTAVLTLEEGATLTTDEVVARCRSQLAAYKVPKSVVVVDTLPRTMSGKLQRRRVREAMARPPGPDQ